MQPQQPGDVSQKNPPSYRPIEPAEQECSAELQDPRPTADSVNMTESANTSGAVMVDRHQYVSRGVDGRPVVTRRIADETILVPVTADVADLDAVYTLNDVGSFIWHLIDGERSAHAIAEAVSAEYDVSPEVALRDVTEFLDRLVSRKLARQEARDDA